MERRAPLRSADPMLKSWRRRRILSRHSIPDELWAATVAAVPAFGRLRADQQQRLRDLSLLFLHEKQFQPARGMVLDDAKRVRIAALACLPILELGLEAYAGFHSIVVHPDEFLVRDREYEDEHGVVHVGDDLLSGEAFEQGPVVFAWTEVDASARGEGYNVVAHEMAHKLDMLSGETNGVPPLHADMRTPEWVAAFDAAYDDLCEQIERGVTPWIDPYAVEDSAEFFAVSVELFFDTPNELKEQYPDVYAQLKRFFKQDPAAA